MALHFTTKGRDPLKRRYLYCWGKGEQKQHIRVLLYQNHPCISKSVIQWKKYLYCLEGHIVHVVDHTQQTVRESNKGSRQQKDEMVLIQTHLRMTVRVKNTIWQLDYSWIYCDSVCAVTCLPITGVSTLVAEGLISKTDGEGTTPSHNHSHDTVDQGVDKLARVEKLA